MNDVQAKDFYEIRLASTITNNDVLVLVSLYQPIIGHVSLSLFLTFWTFHQTNEVEPSSHEQLFARMDINLSAFNLARQRLEAVGLIRTYMNKRRDFNYYTYVLYAPLTAYEFFNDPLFSGLLIKTTGITEARKLTHLFKADDEVSSDNKEVSASFAEIYRPDFNDSAFNLHLDNFASSRKVYNVTQVFNKEAFYEALLTFGHLEQGALSENEVYEIGQLATLYGLSEETIAKNVLSAYTPGIEIGTRVDMVKLRRLLSEEVKYSFTGKKSKKKGEYIHSDAETAKMINMMEAMPPIDFLLLLQEGRALALSDQRLIEDLSIKFALNNGVINALIFAVLNLKEGQLPYNYVTKIAASLGRNKIETALDATNFMRDTARGIKTATTVSKKAKVKAKAVPTEEDVSDEEIEKLIKELKNI